LFRHGDLVDFKILGPLEVLVDSGRLEFGGTRQQIVLAALLLGANGVVSTGRLLDAVYGEDLPPTARSQLQISISSLRRTFAEHGRGDIITTTPLGYLIKVGPGELDAQRFEELVIAARAAHEAGELEQSVAHYRDALRLWRGPALDGMDSQVIHGAASRLDEQRISTHEDRITLELELGRHHELVGELTEMVEESPLREALRAQLMLALYRSDRAAEALQVYRQARQTMIDELGIEPSERLQKLEFAILTSDASLDLLARPAERVPARSARAPHQAPALLPTDIADFTGRAKEIEEIQQTLLQASEDPSQLAVPVVVIVGKGGIGKTSIAVHASHGLAGHYPDGQLFADLHGGSAHRVSPMQVLERFLRVLGLPGSQLPEGLDARAEVYRDLIAGRKLLVVLDDAAGESQVVPLLPGGGDAAVLVTSRTRLAGLPGAQHIEVDVFDEDKSVDLLTRIIGPERVRVEPAAAMVVTELCGHLPLALRIAGARLAARPHWSIGHLEERLTDETRRLDELEHSGMGIRANISLSYESAGEAARRLLRRLALLELPVFSRWVSAALLDQPPLEAGDLLDELVNAQLIEVVGTGLQSQYQFHDLIRVFARERLAAEEPVAERMAALERVLGALLHLAEEAHRHYHGGDYLLLRSDAPRWPLPERLVERLVSDPLAWYDRERAALISGMRQAGQAGFVELCWGLASSAATLFESGYYLDDWRETHDIALEATRKAGNVRGEAAMLYSCGSLCLAQQRYDQARRDFAAAARLLGEVGHEQGIALVTRHVAYVDRLSGRLDEATHGYEQALAVFRRTGDDVAAAYVLHGLAQVSMERGDLGAAGELLSEALLLSRTAHSVRVEAQVLHRMGEAELLNGRPGDAAAVFEQALAKVGELRDPVGEAYVLQGVGVARARLGELHQARRALQCALALAAAVGERLIEGRALLGLSELALADDEPGQALELGQRAADVFEKVGAPLYRARALAMQGRAHAALGDVPAAQAITAQAEILRARHIGTSETP
jgi:DNA-binding SARP family transcriptional activator